MSLRELYLGNMLTELPKIHKNKKDACFHYIAGLPDSAEIDPKPKLPEYIKLLTQFANTIFDASSEDSIFFFLQTDKYSVDPPMWIDKMYYITKVAHKHGFYPFCKKIIINKMSRERHRRSHISNLYGFMKADKDIYYRNKRFMKEEIIVNTNKTWINGFSANAVNLCIRFIRENSRSRNYYIVDPMSGQGIVMAMCDNYGIKSIGIDIEEEKIEIAKDMTVNKDDIADLVKKGRDIVEKCGLLIN